MEFIFAVSMNDRKTPNFDYWSIMGCPKPEREYFFAKPRMWRFDFAWPNKKIAVEIEGGIWIKGRHNRPQGFINDIEKYNAAGKLGYRIFRFTPTELSKGIAQSFMRDILI